MAGIQNFRSALSGFNREDVVHYIEYLNQQHNSQLEQLNTQLQNAQAADLFPRCAHVESIVCLSRE